MTGGSPITSYVILWDQGLGGALSILIGETTPNLSTDILITAGITSGTTYTFAYFGRNALGNGWDGVTSLPEVKILAAVKPSQMNPPTITYSSLSYNISFSPPTSTGGTGVPILGYEILLQASNSSYLLAAGCNGSSPTVIAAASCDVSLSTLTSPPFNLSQGN